MNGTHYIPEATYGVVQHDQFNDEVDDISEQVRRLGYAVLNSGYTDVQIASIAEAFDDARTAYVETWGEARLRQLDEFHTIRALLTHGAPVFTELALHPTLLALVQRLISGKFALNQQNGVINPASEGYKQGAWHRDLPYQHFLSSTPLAVNALFCIDDFTLENGSTFVLPASHKSEAFPSRSYIERHALQLEAKAGDFIIMDCMLFHTGGQNRSARERRAINHAYMIPYFRQQIDIPFNMNDDTLTAAQRDMLGFNYQTPTSVRDYLESRDKKHGR